MRVPVLLAVFASAVLAGCGEPAAPATIHMDPPPPELTTEEVSWQATMSPSVCHNGPVVFTCGSTVFVGGWEGEPTYVHDAQGRWLAGGNLALEWEPLTPTTNAVRATVYIVEGCPDECQINRTLTSAAGGSPLLLEVPARELVEDQAVAVRVQPLPLYGTTRATMQQDVRLSGTLTFVEAPEQERDDRDDTDEDEEDEDAV